jgi:hypothetical protein
MAAKMDLISDFCLTATDAATYEQMAVEWRKIARLAARQDQYRH